MRPCPVCGEPMVYVGIDDGGGLYGDALCDIWECLDCDVQEEGDCLEEDAP
jgi:hypothetical protein